MPLVASVNYTTKRITLSADTVGADVDTLDVYREVRELRRTTEAHRKFKPMIVAGGNVQKTVTTFTPAYVQLLYGCRLVPYDTSHSLCLDRETFTDDGLTGKDCFDRSSLSATTAVDIDVNVIEIEFRLVPGVLSAGESAQLATIPSIDTKIDALPTNPLLTDDFRLDNLDTTISSRSTFDPSADPVIPA